MHGHYTNILWCTDNKTLNVIQTVYYTSCEVPITLVILMFLDRFLKNIGIQNCLIFQWKPSCSVRTNGRTDISKLMVAFRNFEKCLKINSEDAPSTGRCVLSDVLLRKGTNLLRLLHQLTLLHLVSLRNSYETCCFWIETKKIFLVHCID
jgi:hypothetical protein